MIRRAMRLLPTFAVAIAIAYAGWSYAAAAKKDRLQRQCQMYVHALGSDLYGLARAFDRKAQVGFGARVKPTDTTAPAAPPVPSKGFEDNLTRALAELSAEPERQREQDRVREAKLDQAAIEAINRNQALAAFFGLADEHRPFCRF